MKRVKDFLYGPAAPIVALGIIAGALLLAWAMLDWPFFLFVVAVLMGGVRFVYAYGGAVLIASLCEVVACVNRVRKKQPGQPGYIDEAEVLTQPIPTTINKIGASVCSAEDVASEKASETTGAPMFVYTVVSRILATGIVAAKRMGKRAQGIDADAPDDDSDGTDAGDPLTAEPYVAGATA